MATAVRTFSVLELSQAAYDEIERKLLDAGYDHLFQQGPGSMIDMAGIAVTCGEDRDTREVPGQPRYTKIRLPNGYKLTGPVGQQAEPPQPSWDLQTK